jgi:hypothetical protein
MALTYPDFRKKDVEVQIAVLEIIIDNAKAVLYSLQSTAVEASACALEKKIYSPEIV